MLIDCDGCGARGVACGDCVVTVLLGPVGLGLPATPGPAEAAAVHLDPDDRRALRALADAGLVPRLRHERRAVG